MTPARLTDDDIEALWIRCSHDGKITDAGFRYLVQEFFYSREHGLHMRVMQQRHNIQGKLFEMILSHQGGKRFVCLLFRAQKGTYDREQAFRDLEHTIFSRYTKDKDVDTE